MTGHGTLMMWGLGRVLDEIASYIANAISKGGQASSAVRWLIVGLAA
jgi:hypothetical protein